MGGRHALPSLAAMAAVFNLNHHATYVHWDFFQMSLSNVLLIACMFAVFVAAIFLPFPGRSSRADTEPAAEDDA